MVQIRNFDNLIKMTGERAKLDAKANNTYIVYKDQKGTIIKEHNDGFVETVQPKVKKHE